MDGKDEPGYVVNPDKLAFDRAEAVTLLDESVKVDDTFETTVCPGEVELVDMPPVVSSLCEDGVAPATEVEGCEVSKEALDGKDEPGYVVNPDKLAFDMAGALSMLDEAGNVDDKLETTVC